MLAQFLRYLIVGALSFFVDIGVFVLLHRSGWMPDVVASAVAFAVATTANYFLSYLLAFTRGRFERAAEISRLFLVAGVGLGLNTLFFWVLVRVGVEPIVAKIGVVPLVLVWNYLGRRWLVFDRDLPGHRVPLLDGLPVIGRRTAG